MTTNRKTRSFGSLVSLLALCAATNPVFAATIAGNTLPSGGTVVAGSATISTSGTTETVNQTSNSLVSNWSSLDVGANATFQINQPSAQSHFLGRVTNSQNPTQIEGAVKSNGSVVLVNSQGILFGQGAQVNVVGLVATSADIDNSNFMNGKYNFDKPGNPDATISNAGSIIVEKAGLALLVGPNVTNSGYIQANLGKVQLASGDTFSVDLYGDGLINLQASDKLKKQLVENSGTIKANGGQVLMTAAAAETVVNSLINMDGIIQADSVGSKQGSVVLYAAGDSSTAQVSGTIKARGKKAGTTGGTIEVVAANTAIQSGATIDASGAKGGGTIKVGGDFHGAGATPTAENTKVESGAKLIADATESGKGGNVAVWSNNDTNFAGTIEAKGANGGKGGYVETSGETLEISGMVNPGKGGTWLIDPASITIDTSLANSFSFILSLGVDIVVNTSYGLTLGSNVTISDTGSGNVALTLNSTGGDILLDTNSHITSSNGQLNVLLEATGPYNGNVTLNPGSSITSNNGNITIVGTNFINNAGSTALNAGTGVWQIYSSTVAGDTFGDLNSNNTAVWDTTYGSTVIQTGNRYVFAEQPTVTVTSTSDSKTYGDSKDVSGDYTISGVSAGVTNAFLADSNAIAFSGAPVVTSTGSAASANAGAYSIDVAQGSLAALDGYALAYSSAGTLTVNPAALTVTADAQSKVYGSVDPTLTYNASGFVNGDNTGTVLTGGLTRDAGEHVANGPYAITQGSLTSNGNYTIAYTGNVLTITPYSLGVVADNQVRNLDTVNPTLTYTFGTLQNGDTSSVFTGALATTAVTNSLPNIYPITEGSLNAGTDYTIAYTPGTLTVLSPLNNANEALLRQAAGNGGKHIAGTLLAIQNGNPAVTGNLANLAPAAGGPNSLAELSPSAGGQGSVTALVSCNDATPCDLNQ